MAERRFLPRRREPRTGDLDPRLDTVRAYAIGRPGAVDEFPFGPEVMVFKVGGKIFGALAWEESPLRVSLKCEPDRAEALREAHPAIQAPRYFDKRHWIQVTVDRTIDDALLRELIDRSHALVVASLPRRLRDRLQGPPYSTR
jgi:predicted DNA-binding protein (MmcQ/YjbR family)